ncbi:MAG: rhomboid family intramembrane serine protease [Muribaculaceae bacterium]|nr:rhomboid family intramembrane serine protease [Muribaculaceae bacterium]
MSYISENKPLLGRLTFLVGINVAVFAATITASAFGIDLLAVLSLVAGRPLDWGPLTYMFAHSGFIHFAANMLILIAYGSLASGLGLANALIPLYLAGGFIGAAAFLLVAPDGAMLAGASAAVLCLLTAFSIWAYDIHVALPGGLHPKLAALSAPFIAVVLVNAIFFSETGAAAAHIAGMACGIAAAAGFYTPARAILMRTRRSRSELRQRRHHAIRKAVVSGYNALNKAEKESL